MRLLSEHTIAGAEFDSSARYPPPQCHPGTRLSIKQSIQTWLADPKRETRLLWLYGAAGVGKTAIVQTLAEEIPSQQLGATLFFSRPNKRNNPNRVFTTIAYQLAVRVSDYREYLRLQLEADPNLLEKSMREQFRRLIKIPFAEDRIYEGSEVLTIFLDGLDECQGEFQRTEIIRLIGQFVSAYPDVPLVWVLASRPEPHLRVAFSATLPHSWQLEVPIDSEEACRDVERYLRTGFDDIRRRYPEAIPTHPQWPSENQFAQVANVASGLFAFAFVVIKFIDDPASGDPVSRFDRVFEVIHNFPLAGRGGERNPLAALDLLYTQILSDVPEDTLSTTKRILGYILLAYRGHEMLTYKPESFVSTANILGLTQNVAYGALQRLHSVLHVPKLECAAARNVTFLHASFADYLQDEARSQAFWVDCGSALTDACQCWFRVLQEANSTGVWPATSPNAPA